MTTRRSGPPLRGIGRSAFALVLSIGVAAPAVPARGGPVTFPSLELYAPDAHVTVDRWSTRGLPGDLGIWLTPVGGDLELHVGMEDFGDPLGLVQRETTTGTDRPLPAELLDEWRGLAAAIRLRLEDADGLVAQRTRTLCPNSFARERVSDEGVTQPRYPEGCFFGFPFQKGTVWGIEDHWAVNPFARGTGIRSQIPNGDYTLTAELLDPLATELGVDPGGRSVTIDVTLTTNGGGGEFAAAGADGPSREPAAAVPEVADPPMHTRPDLQALPAWNLRTRATKRKNGKPKRDFLMFAATEWNAGPAPLVVEGFRQGGQDAMDAYQYFYDGDQPIGKWPAGSLEFDRKDGHNHWHFLQFVRYRLLDQSLESVVRSRKEAFCLVPTDPVDLRVDGAEFQPWDVGLHSACGRPRSLWIRETLPAGWGDTYLQFVAGQAFNITRVPNGTYLVEVMVNPDGLLIEADATNNVELRKIKLWGKRGNRRVRVRPWNGISA